MYWVNQIWPRWRLCANHNDAMTLYFLWKKRYRPFKINILQQEATDACPPRWLGGVGFANHSGQPLTQPILSTNIFTRSMEPSPKPVWYVAANLVRYRLWNKTFGKNTLLLLYMNLVMLDKCAFFYFIFWCWQLHYRHCNKWEIIKTLPIVSLKGL